jgi:tetratricopeptide (TPR) repeat protein
MLRSILISFVLTGATAADSACPAAPDRSDELAALYTEARTAATEAAGRDAGQRMWAIWADAPDEPAQALLDDGMRRRDVFDYVGAMEAFDRLVAYCPDYAEGYNQRAFVAYLRGDYPAALAELNIALAKSPDHVAALTGKALTLIGLDRPSEARVVLERALTLNPWLSERHLLEQMPDDRL